MFNFFRKKLPLSAHSFHLVRDLYVGMGISVGRLREDVNFDYKFVGLSHNTLRGAAGGALLCAESLVALGYIEAK